jgi:NADPH-dependent ferric siderophore reductase
MISSMPKWIGDWIESAAGPRLTITETIYITPTIKKIRLQGNISKMNFIIGGASVIRVSETEYRNYTIAYQNIEKGIIEIIFNIHGNGVGSTYIDTLRPGEELYVSSARGRKSFEPNVKKHLFFGDETSLGFACSLHSFLKGSSSELQFYFELQEENKNAPQLLGLQKYTVFPKNNSFQNEKWISNLPVFHTSDLQTTNFILTGNVTSVQNFRKVLKKNSTGSIFSQGYWLEGKKGL